MKGVEDSSFHVVEKQTSRNCLQRGTLISGAVKDHLYVQESIPGSPLKATQRVSAISLLAPWIVEARLGSTALQGLRIHAGEPSSVKVHAKVSLIRQAFYLQIRFSSKFVKVNKYTSITLELRE